MSGKASGHGRVATATGISFAAALGAAPAAEAEDFTVTTLGDPTTGTCVPGDCSLRHAVEASEGNATGDRILFQAGLTGTIALGGGQGYLYVSKPLEVVGPGADALTVTADAGTRVFNLFTGVGDDVTISGLTLSGGDASSSGGGIYSRYADLTIRDATISDNDTSAGGGGIFMDDGTLEIIASTVSDNNANFGGGVLSTNGITTERSMFTRNEANNGGGAINVFGGVTTVEDSTLSGNDAGFGAGLYATSSATTVDSSTIASNDGPGGGGGIWTYMNSSNPLIVDSIVAGNTSTTGPDLFYPPLGSFDAAFSLIGTSEDTTVNQTVPGSNIIGQSAQLGPLADNGGSTDTRMPAITSPAVDASSASGPADQRGLDRPVDLPGILNSTALGASGADMGAVELALPSNAFAFGGVKRKRSKGTAILSVSVPGAGKLVLAGAQVKAQTKSSTGAGVVKLLIRARRKAAKRLRRTGRSRVRANVTFTPTGGSPRSKSRRIRLLKRLPG